VSCVKTPSRRVALADDSSGKFITNIIAILEKNGFPENQVSLPLEKMYESAHEKGINFNKVLEYLATKGIAHAKTTEKIIFHDGNHEEAKTVPHTKTEEGPDPDGGCGNGIFADVMKNFSAELFKAIDPNWFKNLNLTDLLKNTGQGSQSGEKMKAIMDMMKNIPPDQWQKLSAKLSSMSPEDRQKIIEQAKKLGLM
jgi:hypothetical protein